MAKNYENIERLADQLLGEKGIPALQKEMNSAEKKLSEILKKLTEKEAAESVKRAELAAQAASEKVQKQKEESSKQEEVKVAPEKVEKKEEKPLSTVKENDKKETNDSSVKVKETEKTVKIEEDKKPSEIKKEQVQTPVVEKAEKEPSLQDNTAKKEGFPKNEEKKEDISSSQPSLESPKPQGDRPQGDRPYSPRPQGDRPYSPRPQGDRPQGDRPYSPRPQGDRPYSPRPQGDRPYSPRPQGDRPYSPRPQGDRPYSPRTQGDRPYSPRPQGDRPYSPRPQGDRPYSPRPQGDRPYSPRPQGDRPYSPRPQGDRPYSPRPQGDRPYSPRSQNSFNKSSEPLITKPSKVFTPEKKKTFDKTYVEKRPLSKRALIKQEGLDLNDFDENKSGYRKARFGKKQTKQESNFIKIEHAVVSTQEIPLKILSEKLGVTAVEITKRLFKEGIMKSVNESIDFDTAALIAVDLGIDLEYKPEKTAEDVLTESHTKIEEDEGAVARPPVVTVMGHVDHGKTSLLDRIRKTNVTEEEAGGITQSIGAYTVNYNGKPITFIDTPGHAAFTAMRARGAKITDIVILVVAADDGIMPQTIEAIHHAKAAGVPLIVAVNKMDKPEANIEKVKQGLVEQEVVPEEWGGDTIMVPVSAKTGMGIDSLLENVLLVAEMQELKANPDKPAKGVIIEAKLDKGKGPVASIIIQNGTLHTGDNILSGTTMGRVRAMFDDKGRTIKSAGPSMAVSVLGLEDVPNAGDSIVSVDQSLMKQVQEERKSIQRQSMIQEQGKVTLDEIFAQVEDGKIKILNLIVKGDVQGSVEAIKGSLEKISNEEVKIKVIHSAAGAITESDVMLADSANAIIIGFNVRPDAKAKALAEKSKVDIRLYRIIYELLDDMQAALKGMLAPKFQETYMGKCEVRQTFNITGVGTIAGCYVTEGKIVRGGKLRIYRDDVMIVEGNVKQLKRFKDDVKEVAFGFECGCAIEGFNEIKIGDIIECYLIQEVKAV